MATKTTPNLPPSILVKKQVKTFGPRPIDGYGANAAMTVTVRYDDQCGNGHNAFAITAEVRRPRRSRIEAGGCMHAEIARLFPELAPYIKWHLVSSDGPMHYIANTVYMAGDRDHWGLRAGEFRQHTSRGPNQADGIAGVPLWKLKSCENQAVYAMERPAPVTLEWEPVGMTGEGKPRDLNLARQAAVWPDASDAELMSDNLAERLAARLPALMLEFKAAVESLGFVY